MKIGFFEASPGNKSLSRLASFIAIIMAIVFSQEVLIFSYLEKTSVILSATAAGTMFITIAGPAMVFLFSQKKTEVKIATEKPEITT